MTPTTRNILAVLAGLIGGSVVNMGLVMIGSAVIPPPGGDGTDMDALKASMHLFEAKHFISPFLAHGLGTLAGAYAAAMIAASHHMKIALGIGAFFLLGGISMVIMLPSPAWFVVVDLAGAYLPMAWLGGKLSGKV
jgi:hypothetical protein